MAEKCMECRKKKGWIAYNYAGMNLRKAGEHTYPSRISEIILPGDPAKDFLCADCANKRKVVCSVHGTLIHGLDGGSVLTCSMCDGWKRGPFGELHAGFEVMEVRAERGDTKALAWLAAGHLLHAERVNKVYLFTRGSHVDYGDRYVSWEASKSKAVDFGKKALSVCCEELGQTFCSSLVARAESLQSSPVPQVVIEWDGPLFRENMEVIFSRHQTLKDLSTIVSEIPGREWLVGYGGISIEDRRSTGR